MIELSGLRRSYLALCLGGAMWVLGACAANPPELAASDRAIEIERFMGDWYVLAFIPIDLPFFSEANAHDAVESYRLREDAPGEIDVTYSFRDGSFEAEPTVMQQRAWVHDEVRGTEWRIQFLWPFSSAYLIAWLDDDYQQAIIGVPSRSNVWILSRRAQATEAEWAELIRHVEELGYDNDRLRRVPQRNEPD